MIWLSQSSTSTCYQVWINYSYDECSKYLSKFRIRQENLYESFEESKSSIWSSLQVVEESVWIEAVSESVKQKDHQNAEISRIWADSHWCQCFYSFMLWEDEQTSWKLQKKRNNSIKS